jgi:hypothetical protein
MMMNYQRLTEIILLLMCLVLGSGQIQIQAGVGGSNLDPSSKITFDLGQLSEAGLYGPPAGLRALDYEFCIPADSTLEAQVKAIDPTIVVFTGSKGRIGCTEEEYLCIGNTHQPDFKNVLHKLASLPYVKQIKQCFFE